MSIKTQRLLDLADFIEELAFDPEANANDDIHAPLIFNMEDWHAENTCGTSACIAGWAVTRFGSPGQIAEMKADPDSVIYNARELLGLLPGTAEDLFTGQFSEKELHQITPAEAAAELRLLAKGV
jgi:hypothetical protein